jgi:hypothetical protein
VPQHPVPAVLYHYTDAAGLIAILEQKRLRATDVFFMNDATEATYAVDFMARELDTKEPTAAVRLLRSALQDVRPVAATIFAACLTELPDDLSQWRACAGDGCGYAVGFKHLDNMVEPADFGGQFAVPFKVNYDGEAHRTFAAQQIADFTESLAQFLSSSPSAADLEEADVVTRFACAVTLSNAVVSFKNPGSIREQEWRLVVEWTPSFITPAPTEFRASRFGVTPYVPLSFAEDAICEIVMGPKIPREAGEKATRALLAKHLSAWGKVRITAAKSSYR